MRPLPGTISLLVSLPVKSANDPISSTGVSEPLWTRARTLTTAAMPIQSRMVRGGRRSSLLRLSFLSGSLALFGSGIRQIIVPHYNTKRPGPQPPTFQGRPAWGVPFLAGAAREGISNFKFPSPSPRLRRTGDEVVQPWRGKPTEGLHEGVNLVKV